MLDDRGLQEAVASEEGRPPESSGRVTARPAEAAGVESQQGAPRAASNADGGGNSRADVALAESSRVLLSRRASVPDAGSAAYNRASVESDQPSVHHSRCDTCQRAASHEG